MHRAEDVGAFPQRLSAAISASGMSLGRVRDLLRERGVSISTATLSYWSSGRSRPSRARSMASLQLLEEVLGLPAGDLLGCLPAEHTANVHELMGREELIRAAIEEHHIARGFYWRQVVVHQAVRVGGDRAEKEFTTSSIKQAALDGAQRWAILQRGLAVDVTVDVDEGAQLLRHLRIAPDMEVFEFGLDHPLPRGEEVWTSHVMHCPDVGDPCTQVEYLLARPAEHLTLEATFAGELPSRFQCVVDEGDGREVPGPPVVVLGDTAQCCVVTPTAGCHTLRWQW